MKPAQIDRNIRRLPAQNMYLRFDSGKWTGRDKDDAVRPLPISTEAALRRLLGKNDVIWIMDFKVIDENGFVAEIIPELRSINTARGVQKALLRWRNNTGCAEIKKVHLSMPVPRREGQIEFGYIAAVRTFADLQALVDEVHVRESACRMAEHGLPDGGLRETLNAVEACARMVPDPELNILLDALRQRVA